MQLAEARERLKEAEKEEAELTQQDKDLKAEDRVIKEKRVSALSLAFYIRHVPSGRSFVFDLGIRRETAGLPPAARAMIEKYMPVKVEQSVEESLVKGGIDPAEVETVMLSHLHWDQ